MTSTVSASDWIKGISLSVLASIIGGASKLAIRKSWLLEESDSGVETVVNEERTCPIDSTEESDVDFSARSTNETLSSSPSPPRNFLRMRSDNSLEDQDRQQQNVGTGSVNLNGNEDSRTMDEDFGCCKPHCVALALRGSGMVGMTLLNPACSVLAMNYASPSILAPFSGLTLVWIVLFSKPLIDERPSFNQVVAASLIVLGEVVVAVFGDHTNDEGVTVKDVQDSYTHSPFLMYFIGLTLWMGMLFYWMRVDSGSENQDTRQKLRRFSWGVAGGSVTGLQNFLKDSLTILKAVQADETSSALPWYWPIMVMLAAGSAFGGLLCLTACMKRYDATFSSAMFVGSFVVSASIMSAVHYDTFDHLQTIYSLVLFPLGLVILMTGVWILVNEKQQQMPEPEQRVAASRRGPVEMEPLVFQDPSVPDNDDSHRKRNEG